MDIKTDQDLLLKLEKNLEQNPSRSKYAILVTTGAYCPCHKMHLQILEEAKTFLSPNYAVLAGFLSPSHDSYVQRKMRGEKSIFIPGIERIEICELLTDKSDWISVSSDEVTKACFSYINQSLAYIDDQVKTKFPELDFTLFYVGGADMIMKNDMINGVRYNENLAPVVAIGRPEYSEEFSHPIWRSSEMLFIVDKEVTKKPCYSTHVSFLLTCKKFFFLMFCFILSWVCDPKKTKKQI